MKMGRPIVNPVCRIDGCERKHYAKGLCKPHYIRWKKNDPSAPKCARSDCRRNSYARGLCSRHYNIWKFSGNIHLTLEEFINTPSTRLKSQNGTIGIDRNRIKKYV